MRLALLTKIQKAVCVDDRQLRMRQGRCKRHCALTNKLTERSDKITKNKKMVGRLAVAKLF